MAECGAVVKGPIQKDRVVRWRCIDLATSRAPFRSFGA